MGQSSGGILRWKKRNRKCTQVDGGEEGRDLNLSKCRDHQVTKEASVLWPGWTVE